MPKKSTKHATKKSVIQQRLDERPELKKKYGSNALPLLGLALYVQAEDIDALAAEALTDGGNDKKIDFCYIDRSTGYAAVVQGYAAQVWGKPCAEANKATDLVSAAGWLFEGDLDQVPEKLRDVVRELRDALLSLVGSVVGDNAYQASRDFSRVPGIGPQVSAIINAAGGTLTNRFSPLKDATTW